MAKSLGWSLGVGEGKPKAGGKKNVWLRINVFDLVYSILVNLGFPVILKISCIAETTQSYFSQPTSKMVWEAS